MINLLSVNESADLTPKKKIIQRGFTERTGELHLRVSAGRHHASMPPFVQPVAICIEKKTETKNKGLITTQTFIYLICFKKKIEINCTPFCLGPYPEISIKLERKTIWFPSGIDREWPP